MEQTTMMPLHYRDEIVANAMALLAEGRSLRNVETELKTLYPGEPTPGYSAISRWANNPDLQSELSQTLKPQEIRIAAIAGRILEDRLDAVERGEEKISITAAGVLYGISRTKLTERAQSERNGIGAVNVSIQMAIQEAAAQLRGVAARCVIDAPESENDVIPRQRFATE